MRNMIPVSHRHRRGELRWRLSLTYKDQFMNTDWTSLRYVQSIINSFYRLIHRNFNSRDLAIFTQALDNNKQKGGSGYVDLDEIFNDPEEVGIRLEIDVSSLLSSNFEVEDLVNYLDFDDDDLISESRGRHFHSVRYRSGRGISSLLNTDRAVPSFNSQYLLRTTPLSYVRNLNNHSTFITSFSDVNFL